MEYDVIIIGGGAAGLMAAGRAGELGARALLLEKNDGLGAKLLITGNGRCNFTNKKFESREFLAQFGKNGRFLFSSLHKFDMDDVINFFKKRGVETKIEADGKVFPKSDKARDILNALIGYLKSSKVQIKTGTRVKKIIRTGSRIEKIILDDDAMLKAKNYIICAGGRSYPATGSTGDGYQWAKELGHNVVKPLPALTSVGLKDSFIKDLQGLSFSRVEVGAFRRNKKLYLMAGDIIFTGNGISGPVIMDLTRLLARENPEDIVIKIDFFPDEDFSGFDRRLQEDFKKAPNRTMKNAFLKYLPPRLIAAILKLARVQSEKKVSDLTRGERKNITHLLKEFCLSVNNFSGFDRAYITSGGIALGEVQPDTMRSKLIDNLYFAGEVLDLDGPTGGFNLQVAWTTSYAAGANAARAA